MKLIKKGSYAVISFICLIVIAGYINYEYNAEREKNLGQSVYVFSDKNSDINKSILEIDEIKEDIQKLNSELSKFNLNNYVVTFNEDNNLFYILLSDKDKNSKEILEEILNKNFENIECKIVIKK